MIYRKFNRNIWVLIAAASLATAGCKSSIELNPKDSIDASIALTSKDGINATITSVYATLKGELFYGNRLIGVPEALADNGRATQNTGRYVGEALNTRGSHFNQWSVAYNALNRINLVLEAVPPVSGTGISEADKTKWEGELKFLRALYHFDLVRTYAYIPGAVIEAQNKGGVPLILKAISTAEAALNAKTPRAPIAEVYASIYADLEDAITKLPNLGGSPAKANKQAAQALLIRVAVYNKDWTKVVSLANELITSTGAKLLTASGYFAGFTSAVNPESLFEVTSATQAETLGVNLSLQTLFSTLTARSAAPDNNFTDNFVGRDPSLPLKPAAGGGDLVPTNDLLTAVGITVINNGGRAAQITSRSADVRNRLFEIGGSNRTNGPNVEVTKFLGRGGAVNVDNVPVLRIAETYLSRAEAYAEAGAQQNLTAALADINTIRTNRGLTALTGAFTSAQLLNEVLLQRRVEFAFEGHRFFDLKRRGLDIPKPNTNSVFSFNSYLLLPSIPLADVDGSFGDIQQNFGY